MKLKYKFQFQNGNISEGYNTIFVKDGIAEVAEDPTSAMKLLIEAHGGQLIEDDGPKPRRKTKSKPAKLSQEEAATKTITLLEKAKKMSEVK